VAKDVTLQQKLSANDYYMEALSLAVSFSLYGDLLGITKWADAAGVKKDKTDGKKKRCEDILLPGDRTNCTVDKDIGF